jgi:thymidine kinase
VAPQRQHDHHQAGGDHHGAERFDHQAQPFDAGAYLLFDLSEHASSLAALCAGCMAFSKSTYLFNRRGGCCIYDSSMPTYFFYIGFGAESIYHACHYGRATV